MTSPFPTLLTPHSRRWFSARQDQRQEEFGIVEYRRSSSVLELMFSTLDQPVPWKLLLHSWLPLFGEKSEQFCVLFDPSLLGSSQNHRSCWGPPSGWLSPLRNLQSLGRTIASSAVLRQHQQPVRVCCVPAFQGLLRQLTAIDSHLNFAQHQHNINPTTPNSVGHLLGTPKSVRDIASNFKPVG